MAQHRYVRRVDRSVVRALRLRLRGCRRAAVLLAVAALSAGVLPMVLGIAPAQAASARLGVFGFTGGEQTYVVPAGATSLRMLAVGAPGGKGGISHCARGTCPVSSGGLGEVVDTTFSVCTSCAVTAGETLYVEVGGVGSNGTADDSAGPSAGGFNGGGSSLRGTGGGGGGASGVQDVSGQAAPASRLMVAGGGGGAGSNGNTCDAGGFSEPGGPGGGAGDAVGGTGGNGANDYCSGSANGGGGGQGGSQAAGGTGGAVGSKSPICNAADPGNPGALAQGGSGSWESNFTGGRAAVVGGGGGGGGYYGGGGGAGGNVCGASSVMGAGGGGGGSSYFGAASAHTTTGDASGTAMVQLTTTSTATTTLDCQPASTTIGNATSCTATVSDPDADPITPEGIVSFTSTGAGSFGSTTCTLTAGTCSVSFTPSANAGNSDTVSATYGGDFSHTAGSPGSSSLAISTRTTNSSGSCTAATAGHASTCTATVTDTDTGTKTAPTGTISWSGSGGTFGAPTCTLSGATCSVTFTPSAANAVTLDLSYGGNPTHSTSSGSIVLPVGQGAASISIANLPSTAIFGGSFTPTYTQLGDGTPSTSTLTPATCSVSAGVVSYLAAGSCQLKAAATATADYTAASGSTQSFTISKAAGSISIANLPSSAIVGGSFTPTYTQVGDGTPTVSTLTPDTCSVGAGVVSYQAAGSCQLKAAASATANYTAASGNTQSFTVNGPPAITSADHATFSAGSAGTFTVSTTPGLPTTTTLSKNGTLPIGVTFVDNGNGTATLSGAPGGNTGGVYSLTITAANGVAPDSTQAFTLTVNQPPAITSLNHATFTVGTTAGFTVTTAPGQPTATTLTETGTLPAGVTFSDNSDGTASIGGTPTAGGSYPFTIKASNGVAPDAAQTFTLTVNQPPTITSADHTTFVVGGQGAFTVMSTAGTPAARTLSETGALPTGVTFVDNGDGTATLAGTPASGQGGSYPLTVEADNGVLPAATQAFTLTVTDLPVIISADSSAFTASTVSSFTVTATAGFPAATALTQAGALPAGVSWLDNTDGTATMTGTPAAGTGGVYPLTLTATNSAGHTDQAFTLTVRESPVITSAGIATFTAGAPGTFTVTTAGGYPTLPALSQTGTLPDGVTFVDNSDGTATLGGTPTVGGSYPLTITAGNGVTTDATQAFTLTVDGPPGFTSDPAMTFTAGATGTVTITTSAGVPATTVLTETGTLPDGVTVVDNSDGTATLAGTAPPSAIGTYPLTLSADNGVGDHTDQSFTLTIARAEQVLLPAVLPGGDGALNGVTDVTVVGSLLQVSGSGYAAGAPIVVGIYSTPTVLASVNASSTGTFAATVRVPFVVGQHVLVSAGIGADNTARYLEARTLVVAAPVTPADPTSGAGAGGVGLADTGPDTNITTSLGWGLALLLTGLMLATLARRSRTDP